MSSDGNIPTDEEFARASRLMRQQSAGLDDIANETLLAFKDRTALDAIFILPQIDALYRAYVFFERNVDMFEACARGLDTEIKTFLRSRLCSVSDRSAFNESIMVEFDSRENVIDAYEGDYLLRMR